MHDFPKLKSTAILCVFLVMAFSLFLVKWSPSFKSNFAKSQNGTPTSGRQKMTTELGTGKEEKSQHRFCHPVLNGRGRLNNSLWIPDKGKPIFLPSRSGEGPNEHNAIYSTRYSFSEASRSVSRGASEPESSSWGTRG